MRRAADGMACVVLNSALCILAPRRLIIHLRIDIAREGRAQSENPSISESHLCFLLSSVQHRPDNRFLELLIRFDSRKILAPQPQNVYYECVYITFWTPIATQNAYFRGVVLQ